VKAYGITHWGTDCPCCRTNHKATAQRRTYKKRARRAGKALSLALLLAACAHTSSLNLDATAREEAVSSRDTATDTVREEKVEQGKKKITTYEFAPLPEGQPVQEAGDGLGEGAEPQAAREGDGALPVAKPGNRRQRVVAGAVKASPEVVGGHVGTLPPHGALLKMTVEEDDPSTATGKTTTAARTEDKASDVKTATTTAQAADESHPELPRVKCGFGGSVMALVLLGLVVGALLVAWRMKWIG
jgi:hypothetical protein